MEHRIVSRVRGMVAELATLSCSADAAERIDRIVVLD